MIAPQLFHASFDYYALLLHWLVFLRAKQIDHCKVNPVGLQFMSMMINRSDCCAAFALNRGYYQRKIIIRLTYLFLIVLRCYPSTSFYVLDGVLRCM